jgi:hypothetical protein
MYIILTKTCKILHYWFHNTHAFIVVFLFLYVVKKYFCQIPENDEIIAQKHVGTM